MKKKNLQEKQVLLLTKFKNTEYSENSVPIDLNQENDEMWKTVHDIINKIA